MPAVPPPAVILLTGINGYLGVWTARRYLESGYTVRGVVRSKSKSAPFLEEQFKEFGDKLQIVEVKDHTVPGAFDEVVKGVDVISHLAHPYPKVVSSVEEVFDPMLKGTPVLLESAKLHGDSLKRIILISTSLTMLGGAVADETSWNDGAVALVKDKGIDAGPLMVYMAAKTVAEKEAWSFIEKNKDVPWDFLTLHPPALYGPALHDVSSLETLNASLTRFHDIVVASKWTEEQLLNSWTLIADVRDVAELIVLATSNPDAGNQRFMTTCELMYDQNFIDIANSLSPPPVSTTLTKGVPGRTKGKPLPFGLDQSNRERVFKDFSYRPVADTIRDTLVYFREKGFVA